MFLTLWLLLFGGVWSGSAAIAVFDDVDGKIRSGYYFENIVQRGSNGREERWLKQYFGKNSKITWLDKDNEAFQMFEELRDGGLAAKGLTFNIYDDAMRIEAVVLFKLLSSLDMEMFHMTVAWASLNVNDELLEYAIRLAALHSKHLKSLPIPPPFITKPTFFFNSETIKKAFSLKLKNGLFETRESKINQYYRTNDIISINTNYSGWNLLGNGCLEKLSYFREDIGLNSYYYGVHLTHPFWMTNEELEKLNIRQIEQYYYIHQQILARYLLEAEANGISEAKARSLNPDCDFPTYNPYLEYNNGLSFPVRYSYDEKRDADSAAYLSTIDTIIKELADRGLGLVKTYGNSLNMTKENFMEIITKIIRANIDNVKYAKIIRSLYGTQGYPVDKYNPAPSVLHHPETSLRDPIYWGLINYVMDYFRMFKSSIDAHNLTEYETKDFAISLKQIPKLVTSFEYYQTDISNAVADKFENTNQRSITFTARQKRLGHNAVSIDISINSKVEKTCVVRLFMGPVCNPTICFQDYSRWYELDTFKAHLNKGKNTVSWNSIMSEKYTNDEHLNIEKQRDEETALENNKNQFDMFKFPERLLIPRGSAEGFNVSLFIMVTEDNDFDMFESEPLPLGFPFDRKAIEYNPASINYKLFNITIYHTIDDIKSSGYFSPYLI